MAIAKLDERVILRLTKYRFEKQKSFWRSGL